MPVIYLNIDRLNKLIGEKLSYQKLESLLFSLKSESKMIDSSTLEIEVNSDRPDLFAPEGMARALKGLLEIDTGLFQPRVKESLQEYSARIFDVPSRPYIAIGILRGIELGEEGLKELIQFQEKIHVTIGRKRKKVAIGIHDLGKVPGRELLYTMVPLDYEMVPLGSKAKMKVKDVLRETEQGKSYGEISLLGGTHPAIISNGEIVSLPPVINSEITRIEPETKDLLIDVTGTDRNTVIKTLDLLCSILNEHKGSMIEKVNIFEQNSIVPRQDPSLMRTNIMLKREYATKVLGFDLKDDEIILYLSKMRFGAVRKNEEWIEVSIPEYRLDVMHPVDLVEEIAMAYGYDKIPSKPPSFKTEGALNNISIVSKAVRLVLIGLGFQEVQGFTLIGPIAELFKTGNIKPIKIKNPVSEEISWVRPSTSFSLLTFLRENQHAELPLRIFEIGDFAYQNDDKLVQKKSVAIAIMKDELSFEEIQAPVYSLLSSLGLEVSFRKYNINYLLEGRTARIIANDLPIGIVGEVHPYILTLLEIKFPVGIAELDLEILSNLMLKSNH